MATSVGALKDTQSSMCVGDGDSPSEFVVVREKLNNLVDVSDYQPTGLDEERSLGPLQLKESSDRFR